MTLKRALLFLLLPIAAAVIVIWVTGISGLWIHGMSYIADNTAKYTDSNGYLIPEQYSISIDLADLESNIGKELYNDGDYKIYVAWLDNAGSINTGGYRIGFRSSGQYSLEGASLISGAQHATVNEHSFTTRMTAAMTAEYNDTVYTSSEFSISGLNYKDGDEFGFYIFPSDAYEQQAITLEETGIVQLTITNLYKNIWSKK